MPVPELKDSEASPGAVATPGPGAGPNELAGPKATPGAGVAFAGPGKVVRLMMGRLGNADKGFSHTLWVLSYTLSEWHTAWHTVPTALIVKIYARLYLRTNSWNIPAVCSSCFVTLVQPYQESAAYESWQRLSNF